MKTKQVSIAEVGSLPPPFGGVSVHIERLCAALQRENIPFRVYVYTGLATSSPDAKVVSIRTFVRRTWHMATFPESIVHLHTGSPWAILVTALLALPRGKAVVVTVHGERLQRRLGQMRLGWIRHMFVVVLTRLHFIAVSERISNSLTELGVDRSRIRVIPAFLPPSDNELDDACIPEGVTEFLESHTTIIGSQGWFGYFLDGHHVYSFEMIAHLAKAICHDYPGVGFYTAVSGTYDAQHRDDILALRHRLGLDRNWLIIEKHFRAPALYRKTDLFIRPTVTDGDAVSVRECLWMGIPVIASDAVDRPVRCIIHANLDLGSLSDRVRQVLDASGEYRRANCQRELSDESQETIAFLHSIVHN